MVRPKTRPRASRLGWLLFLLTAPLAYAVAGYLGGNIHQVEAGILYRSGQLDADHLRAFVAEKGIRTILNLRGAHPEAEWYRDEEAIARDATIDYRSVAISARHVPPMEKLVEITEILQDAPRPILIHCEGGSDRSGLAAALFEFAVEGKDEAVAARQLSVAYGHFPWFGSRTAAMDRAFSAFAHYWEKERRELVASDP